MFPRLILVAALFTSFVLGAPAGGADTTTLLQNGRDAQALNTEFLTLSSNDPCVDGQVGCIAGGIAQCQAGVWQVRTCTGGSRRCFAIPIVRDRGTTVACTSPSNALSLIEATGADGGLTAPPGSKAASSPSPVSIPSVTPAAVAGSSSALEALPTPTAESVQVQGVEIVTVTVTVPPNPTSTVALTAETTTLRFPELAKLLSSLLTSDTSPTTSSPISSPSTVPAAVLAVSQTPPGLEHQPSTSPASSSSAAALPTAISAVGAPYRRDVE